MNMYDDDFDQIAQAALDELAIENRNRQDTSGFRHFSADDLAARSWLQVG